jgi:nucleoside-diphosphate-sugar epimerase
MKKLVIIGGSGFIGTRLIDLIGKDYCTNIDKTFSIRYNDITKICDIRDKQLESVLPSTAETVVLLAAEHRDDVSPVSLYFDVNVKGTQNVLEVIEKRDISSIIFTSSAAVYGLNKENPNEKFPPDPFSHYGQSKFLGEEVLIKWQKNDPENRALTIIRSAVIFGENNRGNVHNLLRQIALGNFLMIGKGNNKKSMAYVGNVAAFIKYCLETQKQGCRILNYVDKPDLSMNELLSQVEKSLGKKLPPVRLPYWLGRLGGIGFDVIAGITGKKFPITAVRIKKFCASTQFDATLAHRSGFKAPFTLAEGLDRTLKSEFGRENELRTVNGEQ